MKKKEIQEIEFKWTLSSLNMARAFFQYGKKLGVRFSPAKNLKINDYYLDTPDRLFGLCQTSCRLRHENDSWELTLKAQSTLKRGFASRKERTFKIPSFKSYSKALKFCQKKILKRLLGNRKIEMLFEIQNNRLSRQVFLPEGTKAQICVDDVKIIRFSQMIPLKEIELEFIKGQLKIFESFCQKMTRGLSLKRAKISKVATALKSFSIKTPEPSSRSYLFSKYDHASYAASQTLKKHLETFKMNVPKVRIGMDDEAVHGMRVSARRLRAAIRVFESVMPNYTEKIFRDLQWLGRLLGELRDLQLHLQFASDHEKKLSQRNQKIFEKYRRYCVFKFDKKYHSLLTTLNSRRYSFLITSLTHLAQKQILRSQKPVGETAGKTIQCALDRVFNISRTIKKKTSNKKLHQLRISIKKLRYACEFYKQIASPQMGLLIKKTVQLQDILGQIQDTLITIRLFSSNISTIRLNNNAKKYLRKEIHQLIDSKEKSLKEARKIFFKKWKAFKSKKSLYLLEKLL